MVRPNDDADGMGHAQGSQDGDDPRDPISRFAPHLREEFEKIRRSEGKIMRSLEDPEIAARFAADPARTLEQIGVKIPPAVKARLRAGGPLEPLQDERRFRLPNGQVVTAHVKVHFTRAKGG